jgi:Permuted papain-like amidase enzyme, YaeF/YiiX, C92 family
MLRVASLFIMLFSHHDGKEPTDRLAPIGWQGNPWGPEATKAREVGKLPPLAMTPLMKKWDEWGRAVLRDGDIVFRLGDARILFGYFPFSRFIAQASGSGFSHTGVVAVEADGPVIYDTTKAGVRRQPFAVWILDNAGPIGVKRLRADQRLHIPSILTWCRKVFADQVPFDYELGLDDTALYCVEMTEKAFRSQGLVLSAPIRLGDMENATRYPIRMFVIQILSRFTIKTPLSFEQQVYFPGNERHGIWSSTYLETVYPPPPIASSPPSTSAGDNQKSVAVRR